VVGVCTSQGIVPTPPITSRTRQIPIQDKRNKRGKKMRRAASGQAAREVELLMTSSAGQGY